MTTFALFVLMHACSIAPTDRADRWMDELLAAKQGVYVAHADDWRTDYQAVDAVFQRCMNDVLGNSLAKIQGATKALQEVTDEVNAEIARRDAPRRFWRRVRRLGL